LAAWAVVGAVAQAQTPGPAATQDATKTATNTDNTLVLEAAGSIEGKIIGGGSNQPPPIARLTLRRDGSDLLKIRRREPVLSGADGAFRISDVAAGSYRIEARFGDKAVLEWVADTVPVSVEDSQATAGVQVTAVRRGWLIACFEGVNRRRQRHFFGALKALERFAIEAQLILPARF